MRQVSRRKFMDQTVQGAVAFGAAIGCSPAGLARAQGNRPQTLRIFSEPQAETYAAWCNLLAIGAAEAGVAFFVDKYLAEPLPGVPAADQVPAEPALYRFLSQRHRRHRSREPGPLLETVSRPRQERAESCGRCGGDLLDHCLDRAKPELLLFRFQKRCGGCGLWNRGRLPRPRHPLPSAHSPEPPLVGPR